MSQHGNFVASGETGSQTVIIGTDGTGTLIVATDDDATDEPNGTITAAAVDGDGYVVSASSRSASVIVNDNDDPPTPVISISPGPAIDEGSTASFTLAATPPPVTVLEVAVTLSQTGDFAASGETGSRTVTIGPDGTGTLSVATDDDATDEAHGAITAAAADGEGYDVSASSGSASVTVNDNDGPPTPVIGISAGSVTIDEGGAASFTLTAEPSPVTPLQVAVTVSQVGDFAASGETGSRSVTIGTDGTGTLSVRTVSDAAEEADGSITVTVDAGESYTTSTPATATVVVFVRPDPDSEERQAVRQTVAGVTAATVSNVSSNIGARFSAPNTGGASISLAGMPVVFGQSDTHDSGWTSLADRFDEVGEDPWQWRTRSLTADELLGSSSFEIALGAAEGSNSPDVGRQITVWGRGDFQVFESGGGQKSGYDGDLVAGYLGADFTTDGSWLVGMALSRIMAEADYTLGSAGGGGTLEAELTNLHPYVHFAVDDRSEAWAILGLGRGEVTDTAQAASTSKSDLSMSMMSAGARHLLNTGMGIDLALLGDGSLAKVETGKGVQAVDGISASVWRVRAGVEASYTTVWEGGSSLTSFLEIMGRQDGGASAEGRGLELSPGLAFSDPESGFSIEARGRALALHSADNHREYGASLTVSKTSEADGTGLSLAMTPSWGTPTNSLDSVDASLFPQNADDGRTDSLSLNSRVAYGFVAGPGVIAPFAEFSVNDSDSHRTRVGSRYSLGPSVDLELSGDRMSSGLGDPEHSVQFRARIGF